MFGPGYNISKSYNRTHDSMTTSPKLTPDSIRDTLRACIDPELSIDIVSLGLIYDVVVQGNTIKIVMTLTTPGCPLRPYFDQTIRDLLQREFPRATIILNTTFEPPWNPSMMSVEVRRLLPR